VSFAFNSVFDLSKEVWGVDLSTDEACLQKKDFETQWLGKGRYKLFSLEAKYDSNFHKKDFDNI